MKTIIIDGVEYNLTPKVAFCEDDWVVSPNGVYWHIDAIQDGRYQVSSDSGKHTDWPLDTNIYHKFTIQDAKPGDVLATDDGNIFVFDGTVEEAKYPFAYYGLIRRRFESYDRRLPFTHNNVHPATKEQRDQLEKAMADAGYTFDLEKKELKKIEQKPAWSEEDDEHLERILKELENQRQRPINSPYLDKIESDYNWLKFLKDRVGCEVNCTTKQQWKPSDEQMRVLDLAIKCGINRGTTEGTILVSLFDDLKKLKD